MELLNTYLFPVELSIFTILFSFNNSTISKVCLFEIFVMVVLFVILFWIFTIETSIAFKVFDKSRFTKLLSKILKLELNSL